MPSVIDPESDFELDESSPDEEEAYCSESDESLIPDDVEAYKQVTCSDQICKYCSAALSLEYFEPDDPLVLERHLRDVFLTALSCWFCCLLRRAMLSLKGYDIRPRSFRHKAARASWKYLLKENPSIKMFHDRYDSWHFILHLAALEASTSSKSTSSTSFRIYLPETFNVRDRSLLLTMDSHLFPPSRRLRSFNNSGGPKDELFNMSLSWLRFCQTHHNRCSQNTVRPSQYQGFRVINVNNRKIEQAPENCEYAALSYVWGVEPFSKILPHGDASITFGELLKEIQNSLVLPFHLPQTLEDAIKITQKLSLRYLWIDVLCIDRNNPQMKEKAIQSMDRVYGGAFLTICVLDGKGMFSGIPGISEYYSCPEQVIAHTPTHSYKIINFVSTDEVIERGDWAARAWTFQEGMLSNRRLCFSYGSVFLLCKEEIFHDVMEFDQTSSTMDNKLDVKGEAGIALCFELEHGISAFRTYSHVVEAYSQGRLTFDSDSLNAINAVLTRMEDLHNVKFVAGLIKEQLLNSLMWVFSDKRYRVLGKPHEIRRRHDFPSWSWAGWSGQVRYDHWLEPPEFSQIADRRTHSLIQPPFHHPNAVELKKCAEAQVEIVSHNSSSTILRLDSQVACFQIEMSVDDSNSLEIEPCFLLDKHGERILLKDTLDQSYVYAGDSDNLLRHCTLRLPANCAQYLANEGRQKIEFVLLQHWAVRCDQQPEDLRETPGELFKAIGDLGENIWAIAIMRREDGFAERLNLVSIPASPWYEAEPTQTVVYVA